MSFYLVRIELHRAQPKDYDNLHDAMQSVGFHLRITEKGVTYQLPTAEYAINSEQPTGQILNAANAAAGKTGKRFSVVVAKCAEFMQFNLTPIAPP